MRLVLALFLALIFLNPRSAEPTPPSLEQVRKDMGIPSHGDVRGQKDAVGFASTAAQMAEVWELSGQGPAPQSLGPTPAVAPWGVICPHDDYVYAGRVYRTVLPLVMAPRVILVGVFHGWRKFGARDILVFDPYRVWRSPDGDITVSPMREEILAALPKGDAITSAAMHDSEHSIEAIAYWLKHQNPKLEIVPVMVSTMGMERMETLASDLGRAVHGVLASHRWKLGADVEFVISSDAVHYGPDFQYTAFGEGGTGAYTKAYDQDKRLLTGPLAGEVTKTKVHEFFETLCDPKEPGSYRLPWCGRFSVPFGLLLMKDLADMEKTGLRGWPLCYATSVGWPQLPAKTPGLGTTAPSNLYHFVGYPAAAYAPERREN